MQVDLLPLGYTIIFVAFVAQMLKEFGVPSPGVTQGILVFAGFEVERGNILLGISVICSIILGSLVGSMVIFWLSAAYGDRIALKLFRYLKINPDLLKRAQNKLSNTTVLHVIALRTIPCMMMPASFTAGVLRLSIYRFFIGVFISVILWSLAFVTIGLFTGVTLPYFFSGIELDSIRLIIICTIGVAIVILYFLIRKRKTVKGSYS